jgi:hypothetical protein
VSSSGSIYGIANPRATGKEVESKTMYSGVVCISPLFRIRLSDILRGFCRAVPVRAYSDIVAHVLKISGYGLKIMPGKTFNVV